MKLYYLSIPIKFMLLIGCSTTYKVTDYPSKESFHKDINSSIKNRDVNVVTFDSSFTALEGSQIKDNSLQIVARTKEKIPLREIRDIKYYGSSYETPSASIWQKSGEELTTENVKILPDSSLYFTNITIEHMPIDNVKEISYKTRWIGIPSGFAGGVLVGGIIGSTGWIINVREGGKPPRLFDAGTSILYGAAIGAVIGAIVGYIIGWDTIYQFNP